VGAGLGEAPAVVGQRAQFLQWKAEKPQGLGLADAPARPDFFNQCLVVSHLL
jgi:hypothetical protein